MILTRSETPPKPNNGPVKIVVGRTVDEYLNDQTKDILVEFYAPWCVHCQRMDPVLRKVAKHFKKNTDIMIAKYNAVANEVPPGYDVESFPTIYFKKKGETTATHYGGNRGFDDLRSYIEDNAVSLESERKEKEEEASKDEEEEKEASGAKEELWSLFRPFVPSRPLCS